MKFGMVIDLTEFFKKFVRQNCSTTHPYRDIDPQSRFLGGDRGGIRGGAGGSIFGIFKNKGEVQSSLFGAFRKSKNYVSNSKTDPRTMVRNWCDGKKKKGKTI